MNYSQNESIIIYITRETEKPLNELKGGIFYENNVKG